jgi:hypothetical protein
MLVHPPKPDRSRIDLSNDALVRHWAKKFGKSKDEIVAAVAKVGENAATVAKELRGTRE